MKVGPVFRRQQAASLHVHSDERRGFQHLVVPEIVQENRCGQLANTLDASVIGFTFPPFGRPWFQRSAREAENVRDPTSRVATITSKEDRLA